MQRAADSLARRIRRETHPRVESLEGKTLMAASVHENAGQLWIIGDKRANNVQVYDVDGVANDSEASFIQVLADGQLYQTSTLITRININLDNGNDSLRYDLGDPSLPQFYFPDRQLVVSMGSGNDQVHTRINGFTFDSAPDLQALGPGSWSLQYDLGSGNDAWVVDLDADLLGLVRDTDTVSSNLALHVQGGSGNDRLEFNALRDLRAELSQFSVALRGGSGNDTLTARSFGQMLVEESNVSFERWGEAGNDRVYGTLDITATGASIIDQLIDTGTGNDLVSTFFRQRGRRPRA